MRTARRGTARRLSMARGRRHRARCRTQYRGGQQHPLHRWFDPAHLAHQSGARRSEPEARHRCADGAWRSLPYLYRRRRHHVRCGANRRAHQRQNRHRDRAENDRQRSAAARECGDVRLRNRACRRRRDHRIADGGRPHHQQVVPDDLDGPEIGVARARHVQVSRRHAGGDSRGISRREV